MPHASLPTQAGSQVVRVMVAQSESDAWDLVLSLDDTRVAVAAEGHKEAATFVKVLQVG